MSSHQRFKRSFIPAREIALQKLIVRGPATFARERCPSQEAAGPAPRANRLVGFLVGGHVLASYDYLPETGRRVGFLK